MSNDNLLLLYKHKYMNRMLALTIAAEFTLIPIHIYYQKHYFYFIEIIALICFIMISLHYYRYKDVVVSTKLLSAVFYGISIYAFFVGMYADIDAFKWVFLVPMALYYLLDFKLAKKLIGLLVLFYLLLTLLVLFDILHIHASSASVVDTFLAFIAFSLVSHFSMQMIDYAQELVNKKNSELQTALKNLHETQEALVETEKMAALGSLVSGVAHEINTPIGVSFSGASQLQHETQKIEESYKKETMDEESFQNYLHTVKEIATILEDSLRNASKLIRSFKEISVDQHSSEKRLFNLHDYFENVVHTLKNELKNSSISIDNQIDKKIKINSYAGIFSQIFTNLILNAKIHAFNESDTDKKISVTGIQNGNELTIIFQDNGKGVSAENLTKLFDPFYTTKRGTGGSGLGLHIIYNLIVNKLNGSIKIDKSYTNGLKYIIKLKVDDV